MNDLIDTFHRLESNFFSMISLNQIDCGNLVAFASDSIIRHGVTRLKVPSV